MIGFLIRFMLGVALGYVLGAHAGRTRYEQILRGYRTARRVVRKIAATRKPQTIRSGEPRI